MKQYLIIDLENEGKAYQTDSENDAKNAAQYVDEWLVIDVHGQQVLNEDGEHSDSIPDFNADLINRN